MPRPRLRRRVRFRPHTLFFKPRGIPLRELDSVILTREEMEALRLCDMERVNQTEAASRMKTSQSTIQRLLDSARQKIAASLVRGMAIEIESIPE